MILNETMAFEISDYSTLRIESYKNVVETSIVGQYRMTMEVL